jgi:protein O-mannosyl-transferase
LVVLVAVTVLAYASSFGTGFPLDNVGLLALFVLAVDAAARRFNAPAAAPALIGVVVIALAVRTWIRNPDWKDDLTLWTATVQTSPSSFKAHRALAEALYESDAAHSQLDRAISETETSVALLQSLPDALNDARTHRQLAAYHLERGDALGRDALEQQTALPAKSAESYRRAIAALTRCLAIVEAAARDRSHASASADAYRLLSAAQVRLGQSTAAVAAAQRVRALEPADVVGHRQLAAALLAAQRAEGAAVALMTGALLTSSAELRQQLIDMYRHGLDRRGCAVVVTSNGPVLDPSCETVRADLCAASKDAIQLQLGVGRRDDAKRLETSARELQCR